MQNIFNNFAEKMEAYGIMKKEDYCSQDIYRMLMVNGYDGAVHTDFDDEGYTRPAITIQSALKWLRTSHNLFIEPVVGETEGKTWYDYNIIPVNGRFIYWESVKAVEAVECEQPEEALEAAIRFCIKHLVTVNTEGKG